jgi:DNA-binding transcriptional regulator YdaS (Cro superfamily)
MDHTALKEVFRSKGLKLVDIADAIGVNKATVTRWTRFRIPAERVAEVERVTGVPRQELRPDLWPVEAAE